MAQSERNRILSDLYTSKELADCIGKMDHRHLHEELKQELFIVLCELPDDKLLGVHGRGELRYYAVRVILNMINSSTSKFYRVFRSQALLNMDIDLGNLYNDKFEDRGVEEKIEIEERENKLLAAVNKLGWYDKGITELYMTEGSMGNVAKKVGIPKSSVKTTIDRAKKSIKECLQSSSTQ